MSGYLVTLLDTALMTFSLIFCPGSIGSLSVPFIKHKSVQAQHLCRKPLLDLKECLEDSASFVIWQVCKPKNGFVQQRLKRR